MFRQSTRGWRKKTRLKVARQIMVPLCKLLIKINKITTMNTCPNSFRFACVHCTPIVLSLIDWPTIQIFDLFNASNWAQLNGNLMKYIIDYGYVLAYKITLLSIKLKIIWNTCCSVVVSFPIDAVLFDKYSCLAPSCLWPFMPACIIYEFYLSVTFTIWRFESNKIESYTLKSCLIWQRPNVNLKDFDNFMTITTTSFNQTHSNMFIVCVGGKTSTFTI